MGETILPRVGEFYLHGMKYIIYNYDQEQGKEVKKAKLGTGYFDHSIFHPNLRTRLRPTFVHPGKRCMTEEVNHTYSSFR